jgi:8-oxo-dGTP pyrophosphatase MutT (NUDIX family)
MNLRREAITSETYWDFQPGERVMTVDGYPGVVDEVQDGPIANAENYVVTLDHGMGGGNYSASMLTKMPTSRSAAGVHLATDDYPELGTVIDDRPDPGKMSFTAALSQERQEADAEDHDEPGGDDQPSSCSYCGGTEFTDKTDNGRVRQATCATCNGTMSAHPGMQWTPELIGDPSNHPKTIVDPRSGASPGAGAPGQAGINDFIDFDSRVSTTAALAGHDWCTWRREARCTFPGDSTAVSLAIPQDRGPCPWETPWQQQVCPISEPGPMALMQAKGSVTEDNDTKTIPTKRVGFAGYVEGEKTNFGNHGDDPDWEDEQAVGQHAGVHEFRGYSGRENDFRHWHEKGEIGPVPLHGPKVYATQPRVTKRGVDTYLSNPEHKSGSGRPNYPANDRPIFVKHGGDYYTLDGHHRTAAAMLRGDKHVEGHVYDADKHGFPEAEWAPSQFKHLPKSLEKYSALAGAHLGCGFDTDDEDEAFQHELTHHDDGFCSASGHQRIAARKDPEPGRILRAAARDRDLGFHITASWADVQRKAKRIRSEGGVTIVIASNDGIGGTVQGDHGTYEALLVYRPGTKKVADWTCGCKWAAYAFERSPGFQRFEGRKCSHALALQFEAQSQGMFGKEVHPSESTSRERTIVRYDPDAGEHVFARPYEGSLVDSMVARLRAEDADPAEVIGSLVRAGVRHRTAVLLWKDAGKLGPQTCKYCDEPATKAHMWAEHMAYIPTCDEHAQRAVAHLEGQGDEVEAVKELPQKTAEHHEDGERRCPHCGGFIGVEAVEHHRCPHCGAPLGGEGHEHHHEAAKAEPPGPSVSGIALKAHDTGRVLMLQRGLDDEKDPAAGTWEFPGGHHEDGDRSSLHAGIREWEEEVGQEFPLHGAVKHVWSSPNGVYQGHVVVIPSEKDLSMKDGRVVPNPDDPKGDCHEQAAWWDPEHARKIPNLRDEVKAHTPWKEIGKASLDATKEASAWDPISNTNPQPGRGTSEPAHSNTTNPGSTGWAAGEDPDNWNNLNANPQPLTPSLGFDAVLHEQPEPALPVAYGDENATMRPAEMTHDDLDPIPDNPPAAAELVPDSDANIHLLDGGSSLPNSYHAAAEGDRLADIVASFQKSAAGQDLITEPEGDGNEDIAAAAKAHLEKTAAKQFDFAEQQELITEGQTDGRRARNLAALRIKGTHYELLDAALAGEATDSTDLFI